jgi:two-component system nitrogen regulation sensor histidine kinase GlnL
VFLLLFHLTGRIAQRIGTTPAKAKRIKSLLAAVLTSLPAAHAADIVKVEFWREIVDSLSDALIVLGPSLDPLTVNAAAETLIETSRPNRTYVEKLLRHNPWLQGMVSACLRTGQNFDDPDEALILDRRTIAVAAEVSPLMNDSGDVIGVIILLHNLSHQRSAERAIDAGDNAFKLSPAGLAHEVKNPLTGIKGAAELLAAMFPTDPRARQYCGLILEGVNRIAGLVEQVLSVSNPQRLKRERINIHQVLHGALRMAGLFPDSADGIVIDQSFDPSLPTVTGDAVALERVFLNLVRNARESIAAVRLDQENRGAALRPAPMIRLRTAMETHFRLNSRGRRRQFLRVEVSDNGSGMAPGELKQLFTPFFTTKASGTGLGLVLSQRIVALHGGKLWAEPGGPRMPPSVREAAAVDAAGRAGSTTTAGKLERDATSAIVTAITDAPPPGMTFCLVLPLDSD